MVCNLSGFKERLSGDALKLGRMSKFTGFALFVTHLLI
jgi:hypothetical protein